MVGIQDEKKFHKRKTVEALDRMKDAVISEDLNNAKRQKSAASHHLEEVERLKSEEN